MPVRLKFRPFVWLGLCLTVVLALITFAAKTPSTAATPGTAIPATAAPTAAPVSMTQGVKKTVLQNGLTVLTKEVHTAPVVSVQVWYRVGSRNEAPEQNGISHQLEHLLFKGTVDRPLQFGRFFNVLGSQSNAFTGYDETAYFGTVESNKLEALLVLEADRMLNSVIGSEQLDSERQVVISELQGYENSPDYRLTRAVMAAAFPHHPYGQMPGGTKAVVEQFTPEQVQRYYRTYYRPDNAILVITGDFVTASVLQTVQELFGHLVPPQAAAALDADSASFANSAQQRSQQSSAPTAPIRLQEAGSVALLEAVYPLPKLNHPDVPAINLMDYILTAGRNSRLYQALVESGLASSVSAYPETLLELGWYTILAVAAPEQDLAQLDRVLQQAVAEIRQNPVTEEELQRAKALLKTAIVLNNQDITSQASQLAYDQTVADDYRYSDRYLAALEQVTVADIQRVAQTYLDPSQRTLGLFEPTAIAGQANLATADRSEPTIESFSPSQPVDPAEVARYLPPIPPSTTTSQALPTQFTLDNGLQVLLLPDPSTPMVNLSGWIGAGGSGFDPEAKAGLASLTADNLMNGTQRQTALSLAQTLEDVGAELSFGAYQEGVSFSGYALNHHLPTLVQTLAEVLQQATFPADQLELSRQRALTSLKAELDDPSSLGWRIFQQAIYPSGHPFHTFPTETSLKQITQADLVQFYRTYYHPGATSLVLVGDLNPEQVRSLLTQQLGRWLPAQTTKLDVPSVPLPPSTVRLSRSIPGKTEAVTYLGYQGISRTDPRFYPALVLNQILGGETLSSRLGLEIRDRQGLTYGIYSFFDTGINPGPFAIEMQTAPEDVERAIESTVALLQQLRQQGITAAELETAKRSLTSSYAVDLANPSSLASAILGNQIYGLSPEELRQFPQKIKAVTLEQVQQTIEDLIHPDQLVIVTTGPGN
ncbi:MAG: insulinase family protein [Elainella sp. C42_A2020_010]|nr:insulinase family protein [Elainella sp. C42_A2020_010]RNJ67492.1 MAG: insulinase family protein [Leptolyngbya sp. IPPAS B-1204]